MEYVLIAITSVLVGAAGAALAVYGVSRRRIGALQQQNAVETEARIIAEQRNARIPELETQLANRDGQIAELQQECSALRAERTGLMTRLEEQEKAAKEKLALLEEARNKLSDAFKALSQEALKSNSTQFLELAKTNLDKYQEGAKSELEKRQKAIDELVKPLRESLTKVDDKLGLIEKARATDYEKLADRMRALLESEEKLRKETGNLVTALRRPDVRGRWGEIQLKRVVEIAGMVEYCDFTTQESASVGTGRIRPDMIVRLPNDRIVVVDSKTPLDAYLASIEAVDEVSRKEQLKRHAGHVLTQMQNLGAKGYWDQFTQAPEFVVMFLPGEMFFSAALEQEPRLIEMGVEKKVILATPTTLIALLRAVSYGWQQQRIAENAQAISDLGKKLYDRIGTLIGHFGAIGKNLDRATDAYNKAVGSMERSVLVSARKFKELGAATGPDLIAPRTVDERARELQAPESDQDATIPQPTDDS